MEGSVARAKDKILITVFEADDLEQKIMDSIPDGSVFIFQRISPDGRVNRLVQSTDAHMYLEKGRSILDHDYVTGLSKSVGS